MNHTARIRLSRSAAVETAFKQNAGKIAGVIVEPYPGNAGFYLPKPGYLQFLRDITAREGALLIFDEVMTGFRISTAGVAGKEGITADITTLGKVIGGGLPVGAFGGRLEALSARLEEGVRAALHDLHLPLTFKRSGSMFCLFFTTQDVVDLETASSGSFDMFKRYFLSMLDQGVYMAPSPYETGFISTAHTEDDIDRTTAAMRNALASHT